MTKDVGGLERDSRVPAISPSEFYNRVADQDSRPVPDVLREDRPYAGGSFEVPIERFISKDYHDLEVERLWKRVWQVACREEEIPEVGDVYLYEVATLQYIVVRSGPDTIKAYPNACLHRGRQLVDCSKRAGVLRCPFHGFTWDLDGRIAAIPNAWEFSRIEDPAHWQLPECQVGVWGGFVFINPDPSAGSLQDFLGDIDRHYERYPLEKRAIAGHGRKVVHANWKVAQEAFLESLHVYGTHPQLVPQGSHSDMKYDCYGNYSRTIGVNYIPNQAMAFDPTNQDIIDSAVDWRVGQERLFTVEEGVPLRRQMAKTARDNVARLTGKSADDFSDSELVDICFMSIFPNIHPWTLFSRICYQFRPYKDDPDRCWMDIYQLVPVNEIDGRPAPAAVEFLTDEQDWTQAKGINAFLARISNQDVFNMKPVQDGMKTSNRTCVEYSEYQESRIRHFHDLLTKWVGR
jgi:phenylpropionate dioxygenase-like ring-hydroxylating dioxygenase large terminal subunit